MGMTARPFLDRLFRTAIAAAHPASCLPPHLPAPPRTGRLIVLAAGKAAGSMIEAAETAYADRHSGRLTGIAVARQGYGRPTRVVPMVEAGHPIPNAAGLEAAERALALAGWRGPGRSRAGADVGRRIGQLDRACRGIIVRREAGGDARAAALRRQHRRDQYGAQASLAHQGRAACARRAARRASSRSRFPTCRATTRP